jgi:hypothetical protein
MLWQFSVTSSSYPPPHYYLHYYYCYYYHHLLYHHHRHLRRRIYGFINVVIIRALMIFLPDAYVLLSKYTRNPPCI